MHKSMNFLSGRSANLGAQPKSHRLAAPSVACRFGVGGVHAGAMIQVTSKPHGLIGNSSSYALLHYTS